ncbi:MAG: DUF4089 domain-containing protein [Burkholderiaceae bacterium]
MSTSFAETRHVQAMAQILDLSIAPEWEASVVTNLALVEAAAEQVMTFALPDDIEPAVTFSAL